MRTETIIVRVVNLLRGLCASMSSKEYADTVEWLIEQLQAEIDAARSNG